MQKASSSIFSWESMIVVLLLSCPPFFFFNSKLHKKKKHILVASNNGISLSSLIYRLILPRWTGIRHLGCSYYSMSHGTIATRLIKMKGTGWWKLWSHYFMLLVWTSCWLAMFMLMNARYGIEFSEAEI